MFKRYIKKNTGAVYGFYIYHNVKRDEKVISIYLGKETDVLEEIEMVCNFIAQGLIWISSEKDVDKYLELFK